MGSIGLFSFFLGILFCPAHLVSQISLYQVFGENITPKSVVHDHKGLFAAQNMMYKHSITMYAANGVLLQTIHDTVNLHQFGYTEYENVPYRGAPVEACFTPDGRYLWVSNYAMYGPGFNKEGCDGCSGDHYDPSFLFKINTLTYQIESVIKVGSVPKFVAISDNGKLLLVSNWTSSDVSVIDLETEKEIKRVKVGARPRGIAIDKLNQKAYVAIMGGRDIAVINLLNFSVNYIKNVGKGPRHLIIDKANTFLYVSVNSGNVISKINLHTGKIYHCKTNAGPRSMVLSADEAYLYVVNYYDNTFQKVFTSEMKVAETVKTFQKPIGIAGDWKNGRIWVSCYSGKIQVFNDGELLNNTEEFVDTEEILYPKIKMAGYITTMLEKPFEEEPDYATVFGILESEDSLSIVESEPTGDIDQDENVAINGKREGGYEVIVGSFSAVNNAKYLESLLASQTLQAKLVPSSGGKTTLVSVGQYENVLTAADHVKALKVQHRLNAWIYDTKKE